MRDELLAKIKGAGVVGAGGAGFPTHVKVAATVDYVIVNGAECEPLIMVDQQLLHLMSETVLKGLEVVLQITGAAKGILALKGKYKEAISALKKNIKNERLELFILDDFYPAGDEQVLVYEVTKRVVPEGGIPLKAGCVVINVETLINIAASIEGIPVTDTYLTITGDVPDPLTVKVPVGTPVSEVVALAGKDNLKGMYVIDGGPMMGKIVINPGQPVTKTTKALIVLPENHPLIQKKVKPIEMILKQARVACIQCRRCTDLCPRYLLGHSIEPHKIMRTVSYAFNEVEFIKTVFFCSECGACEQYACPMFLSPRRINAKLKQELSIKGIKANPSSALPEPVYIREYRKIPSKRLKVQLGIEAYDHPAPLKDIRFEPQRVKIPLLQHIGKKAVPTVKIGQSVNKGDLIASIPENSLGANIHASISGTVVEIADCIVIETSKRAKRGSAGAGE
ncbi:Ion-translocating oxidoreductase complex subunit C [Moorella humiferrea]|uniref:4Fe-4S dicluster domain-containing protein n=1 Tax=Neomoorella humiferrea TaxID=676965 RepID=UPI0030D5E527